MRTIAVAAVALSVVGGAAQPRGRIAFSAGPLEAGESNIYVYDLGKRRLTRLTHDRGVHFDPTLSPDGSRVAFRSIANDNEEVRVVNVDGSGSRNLTRNPALDYSPAWSPDGRKIAFASTRGNANEIPHIWVMDTDGGNPHLLTRAFTGEYPSWSPDGRRIAFASNVDVTNAGFEIVVVNADGSRPRRLTRNHVYEMGPAWSPNGRWIAFYSSRGRRPGYHDVWLMRADGTHRRRLTRSLGELPAWSPSGRWIVYAGPSGLMVVHPNGKGRRPLRTGVPGGNFASWSR